MEVLHPPQPAPSQPAVEAQPAGADSLYTPEMIDAIKYLGLTDSIFDDTTMNRVREITEYFKGGDLESLDLTLGNPHGMSRLDKIYSYMRLSKQSDDIRRREQIIEEAKSNFIQTNN